ncbi:MAG: hypothetical protein RLY16_1230, partial [Bacteroidota bacterium]
VDEIRDNQLSLTDFSLHDATIDLLHVVKAQENVSDDLKEVLQILNRKKTEMKRDQTELNRLSLVASLNESGIIILNERGNILWSNEGFSKLTGYTKEEIIQLPFSQLGHLEEPEALKIHSMLACMGEGSTMIEQFQFKRKHGTKFWCKAKGQPLPDGLDVERQFFMILEDVTHQRAQEERLKILSLIAEDNINAVIIANAKGEIEWVNRSFTQMTGFSKDEVMGRKPGSFLQGPGTNEESKVFMQEKLKQGESFSTEVLNYSRTGQAYWVNIQCQPIKGEGGKVIGFFAIEENVTEKKHSAQKLQESQNRLTSLISNLQAGILVEDEHRKIVLVNPLFCEMFQVPAPAEALVGADCSSSAQQAKHLFKDPHGFVSDISKLLTRKTLVIGDVLELADGRFYSRDYIPIYIDAIYRGHLWKYTDVTAEKLAQQALSIREEKYRSIIANMNLGLLEVNNDEVIQYANNSFCEMSGYSLYELIGQSARALFTENEMSVATIERNEKRKAGVSDAYELRVKNKNGDPLWWLISGAPMFNDNREMIGSIGIHLDITHQKTLQTQLKAAKEVAEKAQAAEQEFLANMSHEIRTPLNAIAGMTYLLQDTPVNKEQKEYLDVVQSSTEILLRLVTNILDITKIEAGKIEANYKEIDIVRLLNGLEKTIRIQHKNSDVQVLFEYPNSPVQYVVSDDLLITQILLNILTNASKFTEKGNIKLQAELYSNLDDKVLLNVVISDTGRGISRVEQSRIFEKFIQGGDEESRAKGSGLGLAITKKLIEFLNGSIHLESQEGVGTKFSILLPLKKGKTVGKLEVPLLVEEEVESLAGYRVLVAEDNEVNRKYIGKLLTKWEVHHDFAVNGAEALELLQIPDSYDLVLMDLQMPVMDGIQATLEIRNSNEWYKNIPIVGVSATAIIGLKQKARESGINDFVSKPYTPTQLKTAMVTFLKTLTPKASLINEKPANAVVESTVVAAPKKLVFEFDPELNRAHLKELIDEDYEYAKVLFEIFESTVVPQVEDVKKLYEQNDRIPFGRLVHKIKPTFSMVGIPGFDDMLKTLEMQAPNVEQLSEMETIYNTFLERVAKYIPIIQRERVRIDEFLALKAAATNKN